MLVASNTIILNYTRQIKKLRLGVIHADNRIFLLGLFSRFKWRFYPLLQGAFSFNTV
jgi:hypothetical protein